MARVNPLWRSVYALRYAESLAGMADISGPTDAPPERAREEDSWVRDWTKRAKDALTKAHEMHGKGIDALKDRARRIATAVKDGAASILTSVRDTAKDALDDLRRVLDTAQAASHAWTATTAFGTVALLLGALWYFTRR